MKPNDFFMTRADEGPLKAFWWAAEVVHYVDQRRLPHQFAVETARDVDGVVDAIATLAVCGEQSVDLFGAFGVALVRRRGELEPDAARAIERIRAAAGSANRCFAIARVAGVSPDAALSEAQACLQEQRDVDAAISRNASALFSSDANLVTHGHSGALATGGAGTALGAIIAAARAGRRLRVFVSAGGPLLTGWRLTAFELRRAGIPTTVFADSASAWIVRSADIGAVIVGATAIAANGDVVAPIGTYGIALAAAHHGVPFYVAASRRAVDWELARGDLSELIAGAASRSQAAQGVAPPWGGIRVANPVVDVTPGHLITAIVTEYGITRPPYHEALTDLASRPNFALLSHSR